MPCQWLSVLLTPAPESFKAATNSSWGVTGLYNLQKKTFSFHFSSIYWQKRIKAQLANKQWELLAISECNSTGHSLPAGWLRPDVQQADPSAVTCVVKLHLHLWYKISETTKLTVKHICCFVHKGTLSGGNQCSKLLVWAGLNNFRPSLSTWHISSNSKCSLRTTTGPARLLGGLPGQKFNKLTL